jgi:hypothetical protein
MPARQERARGGVIRYRTIRRGRRLLRISVVRKAGPRGGHTIAKPIKG